MGGQERLEVKGVLGVRVGGVRVIRALGDVVLVREERPHTAQLKDTLAAVHDSQFILAHKLFAELLVVKRMGSVSYTHLRLAQKVIAENFFLCLLRQKGKGGGKLRMIQNGGLAALYI